MGHQRSNQQDTALSAVTNAILNNDSLHCRENTHWNCVRRSGKVLQLYLSWPYRCSVTVWCEYEMNQNENCHYLLTHVFPYMYAVLFMEHSNGISRESFRRSFQQQLVTMRFEKGRLSVYNNLNFSLFLTKLSSKELKYTFYGILLSFCNKLCT